RVLLYYRYVRLANPEAYFQVHRDLCARLGLRGRILIGAEGLNGTVSGTIEATDRYRAVLATDSRTADMPIKVDRCDGHVFPKLSVKLRPEIVTFGLGAEGDFDPNVTTGIHLSPEAWEEAIQDPAAVIIDGRNRYESDLGRFRGAICPDVENFRDFPGWLRQHRDELEGRKILTYCTGGIRCEKLSGYLVREGFENVYQLDGGIIRYSQDPATQGKWFDGLCYVFDERVAVEVNHTDTHRIISHCQYCGVESARYRNCLDDTCHEQIFLCEACEGEHGSYCGPECRERAAALAPA
ncbi:MAG: rhodanese-related sulfurtransferase, partial [Verrucomicrobiae bacterium]|nr:rhodanese-related sulfurtransferase [Verrucomicrobiae bacterium]